MDATGRRDRRGMDGALHPCGDIGAYCVEYFFACSIGRCHAFCCERRGERFVELCVLLPPPARAGHLDMSIPRSYDRALDLAHRADFHSCGVVACAVRGVGDIRVISELSGVGDEPLAVHAEPGDDRLDDEVDLDEEDDGEGKEDSGRHDPADVPHALFYLFEVALDGFVERLHERERDVDEAEEDKCAERVVAGGAPERRSAIRFGEEDEERELRRDEEE